MWAAPWKSASSLLGRLKPTRQKWTRCGLLSTTSPNSIGCGGLSTTIPGSPWLSASGRASTSTWMGCWVFLCLLTSILSTKTQTTPIRRTLRKEVLLPGKETHSVLSASTCPCAPGAADSFARASGFQKPIRCIPSLLDWLSMSVFLAGLSPNLLFSQNRHFDTPPKKLLPHYQKYQGRGFASSIKWVNIPILLLTPFFFMRT